MGVTIKDVAKRTGLSITTVSLVLNKKESRIPEKTRQKIENVAQELNYAPYQAAISLSTKKTNLIALVIPRKTFSLLSDLVSSTESSCRNAGYGLNISLPDGDEASCLEAIREALRRGMDGVIFDPSVYSDDFSDDFYKAYMDLVLKSENPICSLSGIGARLPPNSVIPDHRHGGYLAASHLLELGHTGIGFIAGPKETYVVSDLVRGVEDAHPENIVPQAIFGEDTAAFGYEGLKTLLNMRQENPLTGIICGSESIAAGVLQCAYQLGIAIPERLSVIAYGNSPPDGEYPLPLSTVSIHCDRISRKAVNLIKRLKQDGPSLTPELVAPSLTLRGSTAAFSG